MLLKRAFLRFVGYAWQSLVCRRRLTLQPGDTVRMSSTAATFEAGETVLQNSGTTRRTLWFTWTAPGLVGFTVTTQGSSFDTVLGVYDEAPGATGFVGLSNVRAFQSVVVAFATCSALVLAVSRCSVSLCVSMDFLRRKDWDGCLCACY